MSALLPELALIVGALLFPAMMPFRKTALSGAVGPACGALVLAAAILALGGEATLFSDNYVLTPFSQSCKLLLAVALLAYLVARGRPADASPCRRALRQSLLFLSVFGAMVIAGATSLPVLAAALLLTGPGMALPVLAHERTPDREDSGNRRGTLARYLLFEGAAAVLTLFGMGCLLALGGSAEIAVIAGAARQGGMSSAWALAGFLFALTLPLFRASLWPMQRLLPELCRETAVENAVPVVVLPGIGGLIALFRLLPCLPTSHERFVSSFFVVLGLLAVCSVALAAHTQDDLKVFFARQCVGRFGWVLLTLAPLAPESAGWALYAALCSILATLPCWLALSVIGLEHSSPRLGDLHGLARSSPVAAGLLAASLLGLAGIPPLAGFMVTVSALIALMRAELPFAAALAGLGAVLALVPCLRALRAVCAVKKRGPLAFVPFSVRCLALGAALVLLQLLLGLLPAKCLDLAAAAALGL